RWLMQATPPPDGQASQREFYQDFRGSKGPHPVMQWSGRNGEEVPEAEGEGVGVRLPADRGRQGPVGPARRGSIKGDLEVASRHETLQAEQPRTGDGVGFELYVMFETASRDALAVCRIRRTDGRQEFRCSQMTTQDGKRRYKSSLFPAAA